MKSCYYEVHIKDIIYISYIVTLPDWYHLLARAFLSLQSGHIIAVPTDTIYGIAGLAQHTDAISKIYAIKGRDLSKPIAICVSDVADVYK